MITTENEGALSPKEWAIMESDKESQIRAFEHDIEKAKLQIQLQMTINEADIELKKLEAKWASWVALPKYIIKLPVMVVFGLAYIAHAIRGTKPSPQFWEFLRK